MKNQTVHLGFAVPSGEPVEIPIAHLCVTGQTQLSGKTTTLEALISRSGRKAIAFVTKRGEQSFRNMVTHKDRHDYTHSIYPLPPFFHHRADWQFVSDILGAILHEKLKFQRPWIMKVCRGAETLRDVQARVKVELKKARGLAESVYTELDAYFDLLIPEIERLPYTEQLKLRDGLNIMDLSAYSPALQMLVMASVLDEIYCEHQGVITVIPEAWEFVPNNKNSPVKSAAITLARKGAAVGNFIWLDSQDLASIDTEIRRACSIWILGVQREQNEVKRLLAHIPAPKPKVDDIMHLEQGQFFVCHGRQVQQVYAQPAWMTAETARAKAIGGPNTGLANFAVERERAASQTLVTWRVAKTVTPRPKRTTDQVEAANRITGGNVQVNDLAFGDPIIYPDNTPETSDYGTMPAGIPYIVDDGSASSRKLIEDFTSHVNGGNEVTNEEHDRKIHDLTQGYESQIDNLRRMIYRLEKQVPGDCYAKNHTYEEWCESVVGVAWRMPGGMPGTKSPNTPAPDNSKGQYIYQTIDVFNEILKSSPSLKQLAEALLPYLPASGTVQVEPREYVLKQFQEVEVERILSAVESLSPFCKQLIVFLEARNTGVKKSNAVTTVTGKRFANMARDCKQEYDEIRDLAAGGWIREDTKNSLVYPNLGVIIKKRIAETEATNEDVERIIGQVMLRLK